MLSSLISTLRPSVFSAICKGETSFFKQKRNVFFDVSGLAAKFILIDNANIIYVGSSKSKPY